MIPVFRFAPSPNGRLHLGHAYSALLNAQLAERSGGRFLVRIEDIDVIRCTTELAQLCLDDLAWLGLRWEEPVRIQSQHWEDYTQAFESLKTRGLVYPCFCSRKDISGNSHAKDPDGAPLYPGTCRQLTPSQALARMHEPHCWRLDMTKALAAAPGPRGYTRFTPPSMAGHKLDADPARWGDVILVRKETPTSYHLSVVVDDARQGVTHVVRGRDLEAATDLHILLQALLGLPTPFYHHHDLITEPQGDKLSKSRHSESIGDLRARGLSPDEVRSLAGFQGLYSNSCQ